MPADLRGFFVMKGLVYTVPANERLIHAHEINIRDVVHEKEKLCLSTWRLCNQPVHLLKRRHAWIIVSEMAHDVIANVFN